MPYGLITIVVFCLILGIRIRVLKKREANVREDFLDRERKADMAPTRDIKNLPYLTIPLDKFPLERCTNPEDDKDIALLKDLSGKKLLNLDHETNTDLKLAYGPVNLKKLQEIGENFSQLEMVLVRLAGRRIDEGDYESAIPFLEYAASVKSTMGKTYTMLGDCYHAILQDHRIEGILTILPTLGLTTESTVRKHLTSYLPSYPENGTGQTADTPHSGDSGTYRSPVQK